MIRRCGEMQFVELYFMVIYTVQYMLNNIQYLKLKHKENIHDCDGIKDQQHKSSKLLHSCIKDIKINDTSGTNKYK